MLNVISIIWLVFYVVEKEQYDYLATVTDSKLIFSYETLEKATKYFHDSKKLGEGGSGHVYKVNYVILWRCQLEENNVSGESNRVYINYNSGLDDMCYILNREDYQMGGQLL